MSTDAVLRRYMPALRNPAPTLRRAESRLLFIDISSDGLHAKALRFTFEQMQSSLHARFADGRWVTGLDATLWSWRPAGLGFGQRH